MAGTRIIFMGTPLFAVPTLNALVEAGHVVTAVVTAPDRPAGRGKKLRTSPVKDRALELGIPVLQPERLRDPDFLAALDAHAADLYVVVAFRMLPQVVWSRPRLGTINLHASLLPDLRGAAPIQWAVMHGYRSTGLTTFLIREEIDTGDVLLQETLTIGADETAGELHDRMMVMGAALVGRTVHALAEGSIEPRQQRPSGQERSAPKLDPETCRISADMSAARTHDRIRGLSPAPGAWCMLRIGEGPPVHFKLFRSRHAAHDAGAEAGTLLPVDGRLLLRCSDGWLELLEVQTEGRRRMSATELLRGIAGAHRAMPGMRIGD
ncbi:MAG: methionyl-tRNA formyltransferase [Flavobacteriales bacterium]|nr:methionyl-tRNA formyltransferase [Flavobacteriales bacterium]